ncbi:MAG TPA: hypothetical protein VF062_00740 [Candidatus Limnocylindrales bacterium]
MPEIRVIHSTADLVPDGIKGYSKLISAVAAALGAALAALIPYISPESKWAVYVGAVVTLLGVIGTYQFPNAVKPVTVVAPPVAPPPVAPVNPPA